MTEQYLFYSTSKEELSEIIKKAVSESIGNLTPDQKDARYSDYLTIKEASEYLRLATPTIYSFTSKNEIPFIKKGKRLYFKKAELDQWLIDKKG